METVKYIHVPATLGMQQSKPVEITDGQRESKSTANNGTKCWCDFSICFFFVWRWIISWSCGHMPFLVSVALLPFRFVVVVFLRFSCVIMIRSWNKNYWCQTINTCSIKAKRSNGKCTQANASGDIDISSVWMKYLFELAIGSILLWIRCAFEANTKQQPTNKHKCIYRTRERERGRAKNGV